jgi:hypothetical protein
LDLNAVVEAILGLLEAVAAAVPCARRHLLKPLQRLDDPASPWVAGSRADQRCNLLRAIPTGLNRF